MSAIKKRAKEIIKAHGEPCSLSDYGYDQDSEIYFKGEVLEMLIAALTPAEGWVLVPVEPTEAMLDAVEGACVGGQISPRHRTSRLRYKAMLAARPEVKP